MMSAVVNGILSVVQLIGPALVEVERCLRKKREAENGYKTIFTDCFQQVQLIVALLISAGIRHTGRKYRD